MIFFILCHSPSSLTYEDTLNTLKYANRAKEIKSTLQKNVVSIDLHISRYTQIIEELRVEVSAASFCISKPGPWEPGVLSTTGKILC